MSMQGSAERVVEIDECVVATSPRVGIVLLNWNGWLDTIDCLQSIYNQDYNNYCIVVCDNASSDGSVERIYNWATERNRTVSVEPNGDLRRDKTAGSTDLGAATLVLIETGANRGFAAGNNVGLAYLLDHDDCTYFWILNNDTIVAPDALTQLVARAEEGDAPGAVAGTLLDFAHPDIVQEAGAQCSNWHGCSHALDAGERVRTLEPHSPRIDYGTGGCVLVRTSTVRHIGLLDERFFMYSEDADWGIRMRKAGFRLGRAVGAHVWHKGGASSEHYSPLHDYLVVKSALLLIHNTIPRVYRLLSYTRCTGVSRQSSCDAKGNALRRSRARIVTLRAWCLAARRGQ